MKFDPYIPQCIEFNILLDPIAGRFLVRGAPIPGHDPNNDPNRHTETSISSPHASLQVKQSMRQIATARNSPETECITVKDSFPTTLQLSPSEHHLPITRFIGEPTIPTDSYNDALSKAIQQAKTTAHLPLDEDTDTDFETRSVNETDQVSDSDPDVEYPKKASKHFKVPKFNPSMSKQVNVKAAINPSAFHCMSPTDSGYPNNPNRRTIEVLQEMGKYYDQMQDQWRALAYRKAANVLKVQTVKITVADEAVLLPAIGKRLAEKIEEIVFTNRLRRLDNAHDDPTGKTLRLFLGIYGVGLSQANKWIQQGYTSLEGLVENAKLTNSQRIGIDRYQDFATRIPRIEVEAHSALVRNALQSIDPDFKVEIMGSYRRGAKDSGDIDIILTKPGTPIYALRNVVFEQLVPQLFAQNFLKVKLAASSRTTDGMKWHGASCLPTSKVWRRLDLLIVPEEELGAALLYFTGNDIFNRSIRLLANKKGMRLNQKGLYRDVMRGKNRDILTDGTLVESRSERRIFEILGVPWREATERIC